jgi:hypothetical protein
MATEIATVRADVAAMVTDVKRVRFELKADLRLAIGDPRHVLKMRGIAGQVIAGSILFAVLRR